MRHLILISLSLMLILSDGSDRQIFNSKHSLKWIVRDSSAYTSRNEFIFKLSATNKLVVNPKLTLGGIQGNGAIYSYCDEDFVGYIVGKKVTDYYNKRVLGYIYPEFGYATDGDKKIIAYFDVGTQPTIAVLLIFFNKNIIQ